MIDRILAIEASQRDISVALRGVDGVVHAVRPTGDPRESDLLLPAIDRVCSEAGVRPAQLRAVAVSNGPGGFTGLRVAVSTAKGICQGTGCGAISIPSALVAAAGVQESVRQGRPKMYVALAAKGDSAWMTTAHMTGVGAWIVDCECALSASEFIAWDNGLILADEHLPALIRAKCEGAAMTIVPPTLDACNVLALAEAAYARGAVMDAADLSICYPREPDAVTIWRARYGTTGSAASGRA